MADKDIDALEQNIEAARQRLAGTIDQLVYRASPKTIARREADQMVAFFVAADGTPRSDNILKVAGGVAGVVVAFIILRKMFR